MLNKMTIQFQYEFWFLKNNCQRKRIGFGAEYFIPFAKPNIVFNRIPNAQFYSIGRHKTNTALAAVFFSPLDLNFQAICEKARCFRCINNIYAAWELILNYRS